MKVKKALTLVLIAVFSVFAIATASWAGSPQKHRWEGVAIGIGAAILGKTIFDAYHGRPPAHGRQPAVVEHHYYHQQPPEPAGHWETQREWIPAEYKKVWNPGHYTRHGHWVEGHWMRIEVRPGYWMEKEVWIPHY